MFFKIELMNKRTNLYIGLGFAAYGAFELMSDRVDESILYFLMGAAFAVTWISLRDGLPSKWKKPLMIVSWSFIGLALFWFLFLLRTDIWR